MRSRGYSSSKPAEDMKPPPDAPAPGGRSSVDAHEYTVIINEGDHRKNAVYLDGYRLPRVTHVTVDAGPTEFPKATIELHIQRLEFVGKDVKFDGLEDVPSEALRAELARREVE